MDSACRFGGRLRAALKILGLTQTDLGGMLGVSQPCISKWMRGGGLPEFEQFVNLSRALDVPAAWLLDDWDDASAESLDLRRRAEAAMRKLGMADSVKVLEDYARVRGGRRRKAKAS